MNKDGKNYVNGKWHLAESKSSFNNINPCDCSTIGVHINTSHTEVDDACSAAKDAFKEWKSISRFKRADYMLKVAEIIERRKERFFLIFKGTFLER